jgi:protease I
MPSISDAKVLIIAMDGFEQSELMQPRSELLDSGAKVHIASAKLGEIQGMQHDEKGATISVDRTFDDVGADQYDALLIPGGVANPDAMRQQDKAVALVRAFFAADKPVAAICHGPWMLAEADVIDGRTLTSWPSLRTDLANAGATVEDRQVVVDGNLVTSRKPADIPAFTEAFIARIEGRHVEAEPA